MVAKVGSSDLTYSKPYCYYPVDFKSKKATYRSCFQEFKCAKKNVPIELKDRLKNSVMQTTYLDTTRSYLDHQSKFHDEGGHYSTRTLPNTHSQFGHDEDKGGSETTKRWKSFFSIQRGPIQK